ncbi:5407_t:CDS:2, partial [Ambispora leptoticha]
IACGMYKAMNNYVDVDGVSHDVPFPTFVLFVCTPMAITAFPVLRHVLSHIVVYILISLATPSLDNANPSLSIVAMIISIVLISSLITNYIGIHYFLGGFIIGMILSQEDFALSIAENIK